VDVDRTISCRNGILFINERSYGPKPLLRWAAASGVLMESHGVDGHQPCDYVPRACAFHPERILEYPTIYELTQAQRDEISRDRELVACWDR
jgi:hypothetical protein